MHAGAVGTGPNGDLVRAALAAEGVEVSSPAVPDVDTGVCVVLVEPTAERSFVTTQGAERRISVESLASSAPVAGDLVCVSGYSLVGRTRDPLLAWLDTLDPGVVVVLDPGAAFADLDAALRDRVLARTTVWTGNADEAASLTGVHGLHEATEVVATLLPPDAVTIVRDGPRGCAVREGGHDGLPRGPPAAAGRHQRRRRHAHRGAARRAGRGGVVAARRCPCQRSRSHQGHPARPGHGADPRGDRRLPAGVTSVTVAHPVNRWSANGKELVRTSPSRSAPDRAGWFIRPGPPGAGAGLAAADPSAGDEA